MYTYTIFDEMNKLKNIFDDFFVEKGSYEPARDYPSVRIHEANDEIRIKALVPGIKAEDINIELVNGSVIIEGEKKADYEDSPYIRRERYFGEFRKNIKLPYKVDSASVEAEIKDGVLEIKLSKAEEAKPKKIRIN